MRNSNAISKLTYGSIGELERAAGIGSSYEERFAFWITFAPLKDQAFEAARSEMHRRIDLKASADSSSIAS